MKKKRLNITIQYNKTTHILVKFDDYTNENKTEHNSTWPYIQDHPYRVLIIGGSRSRK